ncbi:NAD(P)/FAD-dependent oxidoreductase [Microterricola viridarii]|uniref:Thioredoxin reductase n=1 Tax=Microterricola viridarii TaxID=412690 RepID=A0A0X8E349_9MICO|nr:NAD(P)/FAD-dependent oxidoreductase [Microterricola viridarii]AMB58829.1 thioredoxin reductase [Microterricola viridarii]
MNNSNFDVAIIGGGAAGLSAALILGRSLRSVVVIDAGAPRNAPADHMHGFLSRDGLPPAELLRIGRDEVRRYGVHLISGFVAQATGDLSTGFRLTTSSGETLTARRVIVASGVVDELPPIVGFREAWGSSLLHCPYCHGFEVRERPLAVYGGVPGAAAQALLVRQLSDDVVYLPDGAPLAPADEEKLRARGIRIHTGQVAALELVGDALAGVRMGDGELVPVSAAFIKPASRPNSGLLAALGCTLDHAGFPTHDGRGQTDTAGVWVVGNLVDPRAQVVTAAGQANATAMDVNADLVDDDVRRALRG